MGDEHVIRDALGAATRELAGSNLPDAIVGGVQYRALVEQLAAVVYISTLQPTVPISYVSPQLHDLLGYSPEEFVDDTDIRRRVIHPDDYERVTSACVEAVVSRKPFSMEYRMVTRDDRVIWALDKASPMISEPGEPVAWQGVLIDVTQQKRTDLLLSEQSRMLRLIAEGAPLRQTLDGLLRLIESCRGGMICSILLRDTERNVLYAFAAPSLPESYLNSLNVVPIGPASGSCGTAAFRRERVVVSDVMSDPLWDDYRHHAMQNGLRACWSTPVIADDHTVLGTFAIYHTEPAEPDEDILALVDDAARLASIAIERSHAQEALRVSEERFRALVQSSHDLVSIIDSRGVVTYCSPASGHMLGYSPDEIIGQQAMEFVHPDDRSRMQHELQKVFSRPSITGGTPVEFRSRRRDGSWCDVEAVGGNYSSVPAISGIVINVRDISDRKAMQRKLELLAYHDALTGLANRAHFEQQFAGAVTDAQSSGTLVAAMYLDVDRYKVINDTFGHEAGDQILQAVARRLENRTGAHGMAARFGGDEFTILLRDMADQAEAERLAERIVAAVNQPYRLNSTNIVTNVSAGLSISSPDHHSTAADLLREADEALYQAKARGGGRLVIADPHPGTGSADRYQLQRDLYEALERSEFRLHYQPQFDLRTGKIAGVEALIRWQHPTHGLLGPDQFIPLLEDNNLITSVGRWIIWEACQQARTWQQQFNLDSPVPMSVNLSVKQLGSDRLVQDVDQAMKAARLGPKMLTLEITESYMMGDFGEFSSTLQALRDVGVLIAIDDIGTGYASLTRIRDVPVDVLKLDRSFVSTIEHDRASTAIVSAVVALGRGLRLPVIAEGIETSLALGWVRTMGCSVGQGFYMQRPGDPDSLQDVMRAGRIPLVGADAGYSIIKSPS